MRVIEEGLKWSVKTKCFITEGGCDAIIEIDANDLKTQSHQKDYSRAIYYSFYVQCPCCYKMIKINSDEIPEYIKRIAITNNNRKKQEKKLIKEK